jgi:predicted NBD/HSP70 family sugar kinase
MKHRRTDVSHGNTQESASRPGAGRHVLVVDVGGTNVKILATGHREPRKFPSGPTLTPQQMVDGVLATTRDWQYDMITIGYPGAIVAGKPKLEPHNLGQGWVNFPFAQAFGKPVRLINDAAMQALGSYRGGHMLFLGLGTGLGSALVVEGLVVPLELAHLPYKKGHTFEHFVGERGLLRLGKKKWQEAVEDVVARLRAALVADSVVLGGGNAKKLKDLPEGVRLGDNRNAFRGGLRLWEDRVGA